MVSRLCSPEEAAVANADVITATGKLLGLSNGILPLSYQQLKRALRKNAIKTPTTFCHVGGEPINTKI
jgi:hypothetical protein